MVLVTVFAFMELITHEKPGSLAPADEAQNTSKPEISGNFKQFLLKLWQKCEKKDESEWLRTKQNMLRARKYYDGRQYGTVNDKCEWIDYEKRPGEVNYVQNDYFAHINTALTELSRGDTRLNFAYASEESRLGELVCRIAEARYKTHKQKLFTPLKMQQENLSLLLNGIALRYTYVEWEDGRDERLPVFGEQEADGDKAFVCAMCGSPRQQMAADSDGDDSDSDADECGKCGSAEVIEIAAKFKAKVIKGYKGGKVAKTEWCSVDPMGVLFDLHVTNLKDSPFIIWKQAILKDILQAQFPKALIQSGIHSTELRDQYAQSANTPNTQLTELMGGSSDKNVTEFEQGWFDPVLYADEPLTEDVKLRGKVLPAGTKLGDHFKRGLYIAKNADNILDLWDECRKDKWTAAPYVTRPGTLIGSGTSSVLGSQDRLNDLINLQMASAFQDSFRKEFVNSQYIEPENIPNDPTERAIITNLPDNGRIVGTVIDALPPSSLSSDVYALPESIQGSMQNQLGTFSASASGMPDLQAAQNTATGMQLFRDLTVGRFFPMLAVKADALDREQFYQILENDRKHMSPDEWQKFAGDYGREAVKAFLQCDLRRDLLITVVSESFMPETPSQKMLKTQGYMQAVAGMMQSGMADKEMMAHVAAQYGMSQNLVSFDASYSVAVEHIGVFEEICNIITEQFGDVATYSLQDEMTFSMALLVLQQANIPVIIEMDDAETLINAYQDFWRKDQGRGASNLLKAVLTLRVEEIKQATAQNMQQDALLAMEAQRPIQEQQMAEQQAAMAEQNAAVQEQQAMQMEAEAMKDGEDKAFQAAMKSADLEEAERQRQHELAMKEPETEQVTYGAA